MIGRLGCGELRLRSADNQVVRYYVEGGFVQVVDNVVSIMTNRAIPAGKLDAEAARHLLSEASSRKATHTRSFRGEGQGGDAGAGPSPHRREVVRPTAFVVPYVNWGRMRLNAPRSVKLVSRQRRTAHNGLAERSAINVATLRGQSTPADQQTAAPSAALLFGPMPLIGR